MATTEHDLDCTWTVHDVLERYPATAAVFTSFGLDSCCGAALTVEEAAYRHGVDSILLCTSLHTAIDADRRTTL